MTVSSLSDSLLTKLNGTTSTTPAAKSSAIDQTSFLKLLTTQMQMQDPTDPMDNKDMLAQLAQFSNTSGIAEMNSSLKAIAEQATSSRVGDAAALIGKAMLVSSPTASQFSDGTYGGEVTFPEATTGAQISLVDGDGKIVHSEEIGDVTAGTAVPFVWDGKDSEGTLQAWGNLKVVVSNTGSTKTPTIATWTAVNGVQSPASGTSSRLVTPLGNYSISDALRLS